MVWLCACTRIHSSIGMDVGLMDMTESDELADRDRFYILLQHKLLGVSFKKYEYVGEKKSVTTKNKVRVASFICNDSQLQEYISDMLDKTSGSNFRADLDAEVSCKLARFCSFFTKFTEKEGCDCHTLGEMVDRGDTSVLKKDYL